MDGTLAAIFVIASLTDMNINDCQTACLADRGAIERLSFQAAQVQFGDENIAKELYIGYDLGRTYGPFQPTIGASITDQGAAWIGAGAKWTSTSIIDGPLFIETSLMPGLYAKGDGPDIGGALQFRSSFGIGYQFENGGTLLVSYDHRSNADTQDLNPGLETVAVRYAIPLD